MLKCFNPTWLPSKTDDASLDTRKLFSKDKVFDPWSLVRCKTGRLQLVAEKKLAEIVILRQYCVSHCCCLFISVQCNPSSLIDSVDCSWLQKRSWQRGKIWFSVADQSRGSLARGGLASPEIDHRLLLIILTKTSSTPSETHFFWLGKNSSKTHLLRGWIGRQKSTREIV